MQAQLLELLEVGHVELENRLLQNDRFRVTLCTMDARAELPNFRSLM